MGFFLSLNNLSSERYIDMCKFLFQFQQVYPMKQIILYCNNPVKYNSEKVKCHIFTFFAQNEVSVHTHKKLNYNSSSTVLYVDGSKEERSETFPKYDSCLCISILSKENTKYIQLLKCAGLELESPTCYLFTYPQLKDRFTLDDKNHRFEAAKNKLEMIVCSNDEHFIAKVCKRLLQLNLENEYVKHSLIQGARNSGYNTKLEQQENMWVKAGVTSPWAMGYLEPSHAKSGEDSGCSSTSVSGKHTHKQVKLHLCEWRACVPTAHTEPFPLPPPHPGLSSQKGWGQLG